mmetsp:Transcript_23438/g.69030  ORF Transcript_23438/g.69030 Transcript_23438/m.69030 type:complete len:236 (-) Transcript_23438:37-744(-)
MPYEAGDYASHADVKRGCSALQTGDVNYGRPCRRVHFPLQHAERALVEHEEDGKVARQRHRHNDREANGSGARKVKHDRVAHAQPDPQPAEKLGVRYVDEERVEPDADEEGGQLLQGVSHTAVERVLEHVSGGRRILDRGEARLEAVLGRLCGGLFVRQEPRPRLREEEGVVDEEGGNGDRNDGVDGRKCEGSLGREFGGEGCAQVRDFRLVGVARDVTQGGEEKEEEGHRHKLQ